MSRVHAVPPFARPNLLRFVISRFFFDLVMESSHLGVGVFTEEVAGVVLESLASLIVGTRMKVRCLLL